jgi:hypothetical protein
VGTYGYALSCQTVNDATSRETGSSGDYPVLESSLAWLSGSRVCAKLGCEDMADWVDRW